IIAFCLLVALADFHQIISLALNRSSEASLSIRKPALVECCPEWRCAGTFYRVQADGSRLFEVKFVIHCRRLRKTGPIVC
ncbi:MAG: hypothetical protein WA672_09395, partial [Candidatus Angelobacter sp.]